MVSPIKAVTHALSNPVDTATGFINNAFGKAGAAAPGAPPAPPPLAPDAISPTAKPKRKGQQESFLSGVAASALGGQAGSSSGKTLLGA